MRTVSPQTHANRRSTLRQGHGLAHRPHPPPRMRPAGFGARDPSSWCSSEVLSAMHGPAGCRATVMVCRQQRALCGLWRWRRATGGHMRCSRLCWGWRWSGCARRASGSGCAARPCRESPCCSRRRRPGNPASAGGPGRGHRPDRRAGRGGRGARGLGQRSGKPHGVWYGVASGRDAGIAPITETRVTVGHTVALRFNPAALIRVA